MIGAKFAVTFGYMDGSGRGRWDSKTLNGAKADACCIVANGIGKRIHIRRIENGKLGKVVFYNVTAMPRRP